MEVFKAVLQLGVISAAAAALAMLSFDYQFLRQQEEKNRDQDHEAALRQNELLRRRLEYREELLRTILRRATNSYSSVKKARTLLRARALQKEANRKVIVTPAYDEQMDVVNDARLDFENLQRDVENSRLAFSQPDIIVKKIQCVEEYLRHLIEEYERRRPTFKEDGSTRRVGQLRRLRDFLSSSRTSLFMLRAVHPFHEVQRLLRADLLNPQLVDWTSVVALSENEKGVDPASSSDQGSERSLAE